MKKEIKLVNKVKHLLNKIGAPKRIHHFGPKIYCLWQNGDKLKGYLKIRWKKT